MTTTTDLTWTTTNELVRELTAFRSWSEMLTAMVEHGYVPTLRPERSRSRAARARNELVAELADRIEGLGYRVYRG